MFRYFKFNYIKYYELRNVDLHQHIELKVFFLSNTIMFGYKHITRKHNFESNNCFMLKSSFSIIFKV